MYVKIDYKKANIIADSLINYYYNGYIYDEIIDDLYNLDDIKDLKEEFIKICDTLYQCK